MDDIVITPKGELLFTIVRDLPDELDAICQNTGCDLHKDFDMILALLMGNYFVSDEIKNLYENYRLTKGGMN